MLRYKRLYLFLAMLICVIEVFNFTTLRIMIKPLLSITLILIVVYTKNICLRRQVWLLIALSFSCVGDTLLLYPALFLYSLITFFLAHVFYITSFLDSIDYTKLLTNIKFYITTVLIVFVVTMYYLYLKHYVGALQIPVLAYMIIIGIMLLFSILRINNHTSYLYTVIGAFSFVISDLVLSYDKFVMHFHYSSLVNMVFYMLAQYLLVIGSIVKNRQELEE